MKTETKMDLPVNDLYERIFALLDKRYRRMLEAKSCSQVRAFYESMPEWNEFLLNLGIKATEAKEEWKTYNNSPRHILWILRREPEINFVSDPCYELGIRLGLLTTNHRFLKINSGLATKILALGLP